MWYRRIASKNCKCHVIDWWVATSNKNDQFSRVLNAKLVLETTSLHGRAYQEGSKCCTGATLMLDGVSELLRIWSYAILDDERDDVLQVQALLLQKDSVMMRWGVLLVRPVERGSQEFMRVGIGTLSFEGRLHLDKMSGSREEALNFWCDEGNIWICVAAILT
jgi:hypothetical protein